MKRDGVSPATLVVAAAASAVAAIVTSHFWRSGTVIASAMTPVIVSLVKEMLARPIESDVVRRPAQRVSQIATSRAVAGGAPRQPQPVAAPARNLPTQPPPSVPVDESGTTPEGFTPGDVVLTHPRRTYGRAAKRGGGSHRRPQGGLRLKLALITGLLAFVIAAVVLTLPELVFGGAVASHHSTTFFGGGSSKSDNNSQQQQNSNGSRQQNSGSGTQTQPGNGSTQPSTTTPQQAPSQQQPPSGGTQPPSGGQQSPAPAAPSPPSGGGASPAPVPGQ